MYLFPSVVQFIVYLYSLFLPLVQFVVLFVYLLFS
jgi:hypothetical protein